MTAGPESAATTGNGEPAPRRDEIKTFLITTFIIIPGAAVAFVGVYGFLVWVLQIIFGPPGPPA